MPEYRGYGGNPGSPSEQGFYADAAAALNFLDEQGIAATRRVIYGESLGTGVAVHLAAQQDVAALILEARSPASPISRKTASRLSRCATWSATASTRSR
jgi:fermentation-respiration switch protein FrsA (DUF1100 family)